MAEYDLTRTVIPHCDRHLVFPLLAHLVENELFSAEEVQKAQYELAKETNMVDYAVSLFEQLHPDESIPEGQLCRAHIYAESHLAQSSPARGKTPFPPTNASSRKLRPSLMLSPTQRSHRLSARTRTKIFNI